MNHNTKPSKRSPYLPKIGTKVGEKHYVRYLPFKDGLAQSKIKKRLMREAQLLYNERSNK